MKRLITLFAFLVPVILLAQDFPIGYRNATFHDADRDRDVTAYVYYPAAQAEEDASPVQGAFPYIVFGHGFMMNQGDYDYLYNYFVPKGYIVISLTTETGAGPNHERFGYDLAFVGNYFYQASTNSADFFYNCATDKFVVMGHSMGGGATHLASSYTQNMEAIITFAAAETDPSAIDAAANANVPTIVFYGEGDAVAPPDENQIPIYNSSNSDCKILIGINGGIHCYFAESQWACDFGETMSGSDAGIEREEQHDIVTDLLGLYLDKKLKGNHASFLQFVDSVDNSSRITTQTNCDFTGILHQGETQFEIYPNPANTQIMLSCVPEGKFKIQVYNTTGSLVMQLENSTSIDISQLLPAVYQLEIQSEGQRLYQKKFVVLR